jgi:hypothetical protein
MCSTHEDDRKYKDLQIDVEKRVRLMTRPRHRWKNIRVDIEERGFVITKRTEARSEAGISHSDGCRDYSLLICCRVRPDYTASHPKRQQSSV